MNKIGKYKILEKIGEGGMGTVYKAIQPILKKTVALKVLSEACAKDKEILDRFLREARIMAGLPDYTHVVQVFDLDEYEGGYFYTMEYVPNSLARLLGEADHVEDRTRRVKIAKRALKVSTAVKISEHLLKGLEVIHNAGIVHRDISPQNVMLVKIGDGVRAKLTDFGIAGIGNSQLTKTGMGGVGKEIYCAPEQWEGLSNADCRSDLYSMGILMYRMVTGKLPMGLRIKQANEINPDVSNELNEWILAATEQEPEDRFKSAVTMLSELTKTTSKRLKSSIAPELPVKTAPSLSREKQHGVRLRSQPLNVSKEQWLNDLNLGSDLRPRRYIANDFEEIENGVVIDHATKLIWQQSGSPEALNFKNGEAYIQDLNLDNFYGYGDWRLPTVEELSSLLEPERRSSDLYIDPIFDKKLRFCWTSDKMLDSESAFIINFGLGYPNCFDMDKRYHVRAVRALQSGVSTGKTNMMEKPAVHSKPATTDTSKRLNSSTAPELPVKTAPSLSREKQHGVQLRSQPLKISKEQWLNVLNLGSDLRPRRYIANDFEETKKRRRDRPCNGVDVATIRIPRCVGFQKRRSLYSGLESGQFLRIRRLGGFQPWKNSRRFWNRKEDRAICTSIRFSIRNYGFAGHPTRCLVPSRRSLSTSASATPIVSIWINATMFEPFVLCNRAFHPAKQT